MRGRRRRSQIVCTAVLTWPRLPAPCRVMFCPSISLSLTISFGTLCRVMQELTEALCVDGTAPQPPPAPAPALTRLLQQAEQLLSDMRREHESAADALVAIAVALEEGHGAHPLGRGLPVVTAAPFDLGAGREWMGTGGLGATPPPPALAPGVRGEVGVEEKVAWMHLSQLAPSENGLTDLGERDPRGHSCTAPSPSLHLLQHSITAWVGHWPCLCNCKSQCCIMFLAPRHPRLLP
jgi:hypothetical protein